MIRFLATQFDRFLNWLSPPIHIHDVLTPNDLADIEADIDAHEPGWEPWEKELQDSFYMSDEQWSAHQRLAATPPPVSEGSPLNGGEMNTRIPPDLVWPAGTGSQASAAGAGGSFKSDEQLIEELVADYREFIRDLFEQRGR